MAAKDIRAAKRYALALFNLASREEKLDAVERDMSTILGLMKEQPKLREYWESPQVPSGRKRAVIKEILGDTLSPLTLSFLTLLVDKRREEILDAVDFELRQQADSARHIVRAEATFALTPSDAETDALIKSLEKRTGENVQLAVSVDPTILGGVIVRLQDNIVDGSVRGSLDRMRERLLQDS
jgi:F-type H+-transporting ATPase subunit delta